MIFIGLIFISISYILYTHLITRKKIKLATITALLDDQYWIFNKMGVLLEASNDSFQDFNDLLNKFEKCFHVYGEQKDIMKNLGTFEDVNAMIQKKGNQQFYHCVFKKIDSYYVFHLKKTHAPIHVHEGKHHDSEDQEIDDFSTDAVATGNEAALQDFLDQSHVGFIFFDHDHNVLYINDSAKSQCHKDLIGKKISELVHDVTPGTHTISHNLYAHITPFDHTMSLCALMPTHAPSPELMTSFEVSRIPALIMDKDGVIKQYNASLSHILGNFDIPMQTNFFDLLDKTRKFEIKYKYERVNENKNAIEPFEAYFANQDLITTIYTSRIMESHLFLLQFIDISEQKQLEQQFIQSQKMQAVGQLAGGIAHDFNNILTAIIGFSDLLLQKYLPNDPSYSDLVQIKQNANRATNLVRQLLAFSRQQNLQHTVLNVGDVLSELSALLHRLLGAKIDLQVKHGKNLQPVKTDLSQLEQVIINLAVNARDAMEYAGRLTVTTDNYEAEKDIRMGHDTMPKGKYVTITVHDTGCGIAAEHLPHIFEPFFTTKKIGSGTGLGLSTVYGIVKQTGGFISVKSDSTKGTTFTIYLPAVEDNIFVPTVIKKQIIDLTGKERILLVEDEDAVRTFTARALREKGYEVSEAVSGRDALRLIQNGTLFDLIVTDVVMPEVDGPTFIKEVRTTQPNTKTIFISGYSDETLDYNLADEKITFFLPKPFTIKDLATKVKMSLQAH